MALYRIDKFLAEMDFGTRTEIKKDLKKGICTINGEIINQPDIKIDPQKDIVCYMGKRILYADYEYYLLNKPQGVVSATEDSLHQTVVDLIIEKRRKDLFPVGRLDMDTEGLLLITNDGNLAHQLLSPKKHVDKTYYAKIKGYVTPEDIALFKEGLNIGEDEKTLPALLNILSSDEISEIEVTLTEGKYHQVKRMFEAVEKEVLFLKRISMGPLKLDETLETGNYRPLTDDEIAQLKGLYKLC